MRRKTIERWLNSNDWSIDKHGHYHKNKMTVDGELKDARMKMQETSIRYEILTDFGEYALIDTDFYRNCKLVENKLQVNEVVIA